MFRQSKTGTLECRPIVTLLAAIIPGRPSKLPFMLILVAINAKCVFDLEPRIVAGWYVTLGALDRRVRKDQGKARLRVVRN